MHKLFLTFLTILFITTIVAQTPKKLPNIIYIYADDLGYGEGKAFCLHSTIHQLLYVPRQEQC